MKISFYDVETQHDPQEVNGQRIGISCAVVRENKANYYYNDSEKSIQKMIARLKESEMIVTFNGISFDNQVLAGYDSFDFTKEILQYDIMVEIQKIIGRRVSLAHLIKTNLDNFEKLGNGKQALIWWQQVLRCKEEQERWNADPEKLAVWKAREMDYRTRLWTYCASDVEALARLLGRITEGIPIKVQKFWQDFEIQELTLPNPLGG